MSTIENLLYSAHEHGKRDALLKKVIEIQQTDAGSKKQQVDIYEEAYQIVLKTG
jgi:hypothetical protein|tara:strand:+ start:472 stop:633 length:162 start_codon:yes stop_codon:yes gene_type:complete